MGRRREVGTCSNLCSIKMKSAQLDLGLKRRYGHGGARRGAGRKPKGPKAGVSHRGRPAVDRRSPVHITLRMLDHVWNLRSRRSFQIVRTALAGMQDRREFRVVHFSVQGNHLHMLAEANDGRALSEGVQGLSVRLAKGLNRMMGRHGKVFADRYHARVLRTPAEARRALAYVLLNHRSHRARDGERFARGVRDPYSSADVLDGWQGTPAVAQPSITSTPRTWLLVHGWKRHGLLSLDEIPAEPRSPVPAVPLMARRASTSAGL
jgi:REP element-mobilizing transposase RayT